MNEVQILEKARAVIADPAHWTKGALARNACGDRLNAAQLDLAVCYCATGALRKAAPDTDDLPDGRRANTVRGDAGFRLWTVVNEGVTDESAKRVISLWNDDPATTHAHVLAAFDRAIELARAENPEVVAA